MTPSRILTLIACAAAMIGGSTAAAADPFINDLRVNLGFSLTDNGEVSDSSGSLDYDSNTWFLDVQYMRSIQPLQSWGGLIYGGELFYSTTSGDFPDAPGLDIDITSYGVQGYFGYAYALASLPALHFEATPFLGLGMANTELSGGGESIDDDDLLIQYGLRVAGYYTFVNQWQTGLELRYTINSKTEPTLLGDNEVENDGLAIVLGGGYRF